MYYNLEGVLELCVKHKIRVEEFHFMYLLYESKKDPIKAKYLYEYCQKVGGYGKPTFDKLLDKGFIRLTSGGRLNAGDPLSFDQFEVTDKLSDLFYINFDFAEEIFDIYPPFINSNGRQFTTRNIGPEEVEEMFIDKIKKKRVVSSDEVINALKQQKTNNNIGMGLKKWIETEGWKVKYEEGFQPEFEL